MTLSYLLCFFFNDTATTEIYTVSDTLSLHDALPFSTPRNRYQTCRRSPTSVTSESRSEEHTSELQSPDTISYAVFCLKKKTKNERKQIVELSIKQQRSNIIQIP